MAYKCPVPTYAEIFPCLRLEVPWTTDEELGLFIAKKKASETIYYLSTDSFAGSAN